MATAPTLALRKLIQTKLNPDDDDSSIEDSASSYEDDLRNPLKRRLANWLLPNQSRRGSQASAVHTRNSSDEWLPSSTPPPAFQTGTGTTPSLVSLHNAPPHAPISSDGTDPRMEYLELNRAAANDGGFPTIPGHVPTPWSGTQQQGDDLEHRPSLDNPAPLTSTNARRQLVRMPSFSSDFSSSSLDSDYHHQHSHPHQSINDTDNHHHHHHHHHHSQDSLDNSTKDVNAPEEDALHSQINSDMSMTFLYTPSPSPLPISPDMMFMSDHAATTVHTKKNAKDWSDGARQLMLETEQAFAFDSAFDSTSFELRLPNLELRPEQPNEDDAVTTPRADESPKAQGSDSYVDSNTSEPRSSSSSSRPRTASNTQSAAPAPAPALAPAPAPVPAPAPAAMVAPTHVVTPPTPASDTTISAPQFPPPVPNNTNAPALAPAPAPAPAPDSLPLRSMWRPESTSTTSRRSTEQQEERETRRSRQYESVIQADKRKSRSVPPPLPPRHDLLASAAQDGKPPATPSPKSTSFNITPAVKSSPSSKPAQAAPKPQQQNNAQRLQSKFEHGGGRRPSRITQWAFGNKNVGDILSKHRFKKVEADEMLTPQQLAKLKKQREDIRRQAEFESSRAAEHKRMAELERQVEKLDAEYGQGRSHSLGGDELSSSPRSQKSPRRSESGDDGQDEDLMDGLTTMDLLGTSSARTSSIPPHSPIPPGPLSPPPTADLPRVPCRTARQSKIARKRRTPTNTLQPEEDDDCYYFKSTPFSFTSPTFRHGHISFPKSEMGKGALTMDDTLDWTAFQMAILGAGDMMPDEQDDEDPKFNEDVSRWFDSFGFESHGALVPESAPSQRSSSHSTLSTAPTEASIPAPVAEDSPDMWQGTMLNGEVYDTSKFFSNNGRPGWTMNGPSLELTSHARSNSAACDPMLPIVLSPEDGYEDGLMPIEEPNPPKGEGRENQVEMACNMNSDLDDFLKWEAQHAFGPGYYGAH